MERLEQPDEALSSELDRLESILVQLAQKDAEVRRLKSDLELRELYLDELHTALEAQAAEFNSLDDRLRSLEPPPQTTQRSPRTRLPLWGRIKKIFHSHQPASDA